MKSVYVDLSNINDIKRFANIVSKYDGDFDLVQGRYRIDAKSIVGIFSLDLSKPVELYIEKESDALLRDLGRFLINDQDLRR